MSLAASLSCLSQCPRSVDMVAPIMHLGPKQDTDLHSHSSRSSSLITRTFTPTKTLSPTPVSNTALSSPSLVSASLWSCRPPNTSPSFPSLVDSLQALSSATLPAVLIKCRICEKSNSSDIRRLGEVESSFLLPLMSEGSIVFGGIATVSGLKAFHSDVPAVNPVIQSLLTSIDYQIDQKRSFGAAPQTKG